jgi:hypothetical protein
MKFNANLDFATTEELVNALMKRFTSSLDLIEPAQQAQIERVILLGKFLNGLTGRERAVS